MGIFGAGRGWRLGQKGPPSLKSLTQTYNDETWHNYTLPKEDPKYI